MNKTYIIYHQVKPGVNCPDGLAGAWVVHQYLRDTAGVPPEHIDILGWVYQTPPPDFFLPNDHVIVVDFSFPSHVIQEWIDKGITFEVLDHHKTAEEELRQFFVGSLKSVVEAKGSKVLFDMNQCGATLAWKHFFPDKPMPVFLEFVRDRDLWRYEFPETRSVHEAMAAIGRTFQFFDELAPLTRGELLAKLLPIGNPLLERKRQKCLAAVVRAKISELAGYEIPMIDLLPEEERLVSDICQIMYEEAFPDAPFVACRRECGKYDLRSDNKKKESVDVGAIARQFGGGGHFYAAGFEMK